MQARPAFSGEFRQNFEMTVAVEVGPKHGLKVASTPVASMPYAFSDNGAAAGELVFVGYGVRSKEHDYDDYAGIDVTGKIAVALDGEPGDDDPRSPFNGTRRTRHAQASFKATVAREAGAKALIVVKP